VYNTRDNNYYITVDSCSFRSAAVIIRKPRFYHAIIISLFESATSILLYIINIIIILHNARTSGSWFCTRNKILSWGLGTTALIMNLERHNAITNVTCLGLLQRLYRVGTWLRYVGIEETWRIRNNILFLISGENNILTLFWKTINIIYEIKNYYIEYIFFSR